MIPSFSNNGAPYGPIVSNYEILQIPGYVVLFSEIVHDARINLGFSPGPDGG